MLLMSAARRRSPRCQQTAPIAEQLEPRWVPAAICDLAPSVIQGPTTGEPDSKISVQTSVDNLGPGRSSRSQVEYRLSLDEIADDQDLLLDTVTHKKITGNGQSAWTQTLRLPADLAAGTYHLVVTVDPGNALLEADETNNSLSSVESIAIARTTLTGRVDYLKTSRPVEIHAIGQSAIIDPALTTWLVIHGRNQSAQSTNLVQLASQIDEYQPGDQVLLLDWRKAARSGLLGGNGENYIRPVATWAAEALMAYGITGQQLNLVGYSWGADIAAEMAEQIGQVNSILAIDSARDYPGGSYNPDAPGEINFAAHADYSWAFFAASSFPFGSAIGSGTAASSFVVTGGDHFAIVSLVTNLLALPAENPVSAMIPLAQLLTGLPTATWMTNVYTDHGVLDVADGTFDAVLVTTSTDQAIEALRFFDGLTEQTVLA